MWWYLCTQRLQQSWSKCIHLRHHTSAFTTVVRTPISRVIARMTTSQNQISFSSANRGSRELPYRTTQCAANAGTVLACMSFCSTCNQHWRLLGPFSANLAQPDALSGNGNHMQQCARRRHFAPVALRRIAFMETACGA